MRIDLHKEIRRAVNRTKKRNAVLTTLNQQQHVKEYFNHHLISLWLRY